MGGDHKLIVKHFDLEKTLSSGQIFRYEFHDGYFVVHIKNKLFKIKQEKNTLFFSGCSPDFIKHLFRLDQPLAPIIRSFNKDHRINKAINAHKGIRLMRQDPWECIIAFLCSSASNIPKISMNLNRMAYFFGKPKKLGKITSFSFPKPGEINDLEKIKLAKTGYRAKFILQANKTLTKKFLNNLDTLSYPEAKEKLMTLPGIGEKIADCICLFSLNHLEAFPVDTWIKKIMQDFYFGRQPMKEKHISAFAKEHFGKYAGYAQQYLFHYARMEDTR